MDKKFDMLNPDGFSRFNGPILSIVGVVWGVAPGRVFLQCLVLMSVTGSIHRNVAMSGVASQLNEHGWLVPNLLGNLDNSGKVYVSDE